MTIKEYESIKATRVSEIVKFAVSDISTIIKDLTQEKEMTESIKLGLAVHSILLRQDRSGIPDDIVILDYENYRSKESQKERDEAINDNKIPILISQYNKIIKGLDFASKELDIYFNPSECEFEKSFFATDDFFGDIKGRIDCIQNSNVINDLKVSTQTNMLDKKIFDFGYQLQMYIYMNLAGVEESNLIFFNPDTWLVSVKKIYLSHIKEECISLLQRAKYNYIKFQSYKRGEIGVLDCGEYVTPQWAYNYLLEN